MIVLALWALPGSAFADDYSTLVGNLNTQRVELAAEAPGLEEARVELERRISLLAAEWLGTRWGLGLPQTSVPGEGKINCGMFVGTVLSDAGIVVDRKKLQRQPAELIIKTFSKPDDIERFRNATMPTFLDGVRAMGDGFYIIGLDFHVGFLRVAGDDVRFIHASYVTHIVIDEDAGEAEPIVTSKYRVVGKLADDSMVRRWLQGERFEVKGDW